MLPRDSETAFRQFLAKSGLEPAGMNLATGLQQVQSFYTSVSAKRLQEYPDADMLLFQWGTYDWTGAGATFQADLTRQFISSDAVDDDAFSQLLLTFHYPTTPESDALGEGNRWLENGRDGLDHWLSFVRQTPVFEKMANVEPQSVRLQWEHV